MAKPKVAVWVGTRKGVYSMTSDAARKKWKVQGPLHAGGDAFYAIADHRDPRYVYALVNSPWFGPRVFRSKDGGKKWTETPPPLMEVLKDRKRNEMGGVDQGPIINLWHLTPGPENEPSTLFLGADPGVVFRSDDRGDSWQPVDSLNKHETREKWNPGAGGMCPHTIIVDPNRPKRMYVGISAAGVFRSDDGGDHWAPKNVGVKVSFQPDKTPVVGQCVHKIVLDPEEPDTVYRQDHDGIHVSHDAADTWKRVGQVLDSDFGFVATAPKSMPGEAFFVPLDGRARLGAGGQLQIYNWSEKTKKFRPTVKGTPFPGDLGTHRDAMDSDWMDPAGIYLGTTTGQVLVSANGAKSWSEVPYRFPSIHSVRVGMAP